VYQDSELLGKVEHTYIGRKVGWGYAVKNERIRDAMQRGGAYQTGDIDKAYVKIKKTFSKQSLTERFNKAMSEANQTIRQNHSYKTRAINEFDRTIHKYALDYVMKAGFKQFMEHMNTKAPIVERNTLAKTVHDKERTESELATIDQVRSNLGTDKTAVIIRDGNNYIYKHGDLLTMYDDTTLPEKVRGKLGLLKLVEAEHYVEDTGCRVNDEVFVIVMEDKNG
jgi:ribosomal protein S24E